MKGAIDFLAVVCALALVSALFVGRMNFGALIGYGLIAVFGVGMTVSALRVGWARMEYEFKRGAVRAYRRDMRYSARAWS